MEFKVFSIWHMDTEHIEEHLNYLSSIGWTIVGVADHKIILQRKKYESGKNQLNG